MDDDVGMTGQERVRCAARDVLESSWLEAAGFCPPNPVVYPHQWLWDSCFHAIAWAALDDERAGRELASCLSGALPSGFVPHMRYLGPSSGRGPLPDRSSFTQPPIYAHAARVVFERGLPLDADVVPRVVAGLDWLWSCRRSAEGLLVIVHPWESGSDDSPRWDSWVGLPTYDHSAYSSWDRALVAHTSYDISGAAVSSTGFACASAAFNAFAAHAARETYALTGDVRWQARGDELASAMDEQLWNDHTGLWSDLALVGEGATTSVPTLDGALGALSTNDPAKATRALDQLTAADRFGLPYGLAFVPPGHPSYQPEEYWRGPAWPQLNYMAGQAALRWGRDDLYAGIARTSLQGALTSGFAEYWNPETGRGLGAIPQGWAAIAATYC
jgi:hypothetical protein